MNTSERLRNARVRAGYNTAAEFARAAEVPEVTYRAHENGSRDLTIRAAQSYSDKLKSNWKWLMFGQQYIEDIAAEVRGLSIDYPEHIKKLIDFGDWLSQLPPPTPMNSEGRAAVITHLRGEFSKAYSGKNSES